MSRPKRHVTEGFGTTIIDDGPRLQFMTEPLMPNWRGRKEELENIHDAVTGGAKRIAVTGISGVGKTTLVRKYMEDHTGVENAHLVMRSGNYVEILMSFRNLAFTKLKMEPKTKDGATKDMETVLEDLKKELADKKPFFIFDNVRDPADIVPFVDKLPSDAVLFVTSQLTEWDGFHVVPVNVLTEEDCCDVINATIDGDIALPRWQVRKLAELIHCHPMTLQLAIAYIKLRAIMANLCLNKFQVTDWSKLYQPLFYAITEEFPEEEAAGIPYVKSTCAAGEISLAHIIRSNDDNLMEETWEAQSFFPPDGVTYEDTVTVMVVDKRDVIAYRIIALDKRQLLTLDKGIVTMSELLQRRGRKKLRDEGRYEQRLEQILKVASEIELEHALSAWNFAVECESLAEKYADVEKDIVKRLIDEFDPEDELIARAVRTVPSRP